jgi:isochorismate synthase EntC
VTLPTTQDILSDKGFYVLQSPSQGLFWGPLLEAKNEAIGAFFSFDLKEEVYLGPYKPIQDISCFSTYESEPKKLEFLSEGEQKYAERFNAFKRQTEVEKAVLFETYKAKTTFSQKSYMHFLKKLLNLSKNINGYVYAFYDPKKKRALVGLSPEFLYMTGSNGKVVTNAVAGSQKIADLKPWSEKLKNEHRYVEECLKKALGGKVKFSEVETLKYGDLAHLSSKGEIQGEVEYLAFKLHPTAAVGTLPKEAYKKLNLGPEPRGFYGGFAELKDIDLPFALVTIRGLEWANDDIKVSIGGGVLKESSLHEEWSELDFKWTQFQKLFGLS